MATMGGPMGNMYVVGNDLTLVKYNISGCMGCHGSQGQKYGGDFSVLLARGRVLVPDVIGENEENAEAMRALSTKYLRDGTQ